MARIITIAGHKGGIGKTTTALNLGAALSRRKRRVLLIDMDHQQCLGDALQISLPTDGASMAHVLAGRRPLSDVLLDVRGMCLAPAGDGLAAAEAQLGREDALRDAVGPLARRFDYIIIDCPPSLGMLSLNGMAAASEVILPVQTEYLALRRLGATLDTIRRVQHEANPKLKVLGILPTLYARNTLHGQEAYAQLIEQLGREYRIFDPIPRTVRFAEAAVAGLPIIDYAPDQDGARAYLALAKEVDR